MPYKFAVECACDKLAATRVYAGKNYTDALALEHWHKYGNKVDGNPLTMKFLEEVFKDVEIHGENFVLSKKYMRRKFNEICLIEDNKE